MDTTRLPTKLKKVPNWLVNHTKAKNTTKANDLITLGIYEIIEELANARAKTDVHPSEWHYEKIVKEAEEDVYLRERLYAQAAEMAFIAIAEMENACQPIQTHLALFLKENGLLKYLEIDTILEFLEGKKSPWDGVGKPPGNHYEIDFMVEYLVPLMEKNGYPRERILDVSINYQKSRVAIPWIKTQLKNTIERLKEIKAAIKTCTDEEERIQLEKSLEEAHKIEPKLMKTLEILWDEMGKTAEEGMSRAQFQQAMKDVAKGRNDVKSLGYKYLLKGGGVLMISCDTAKMMNAISGLLENLVDFHLGTPEEMVAEIVDMLTKKNTKYSLPIPTSMEQWEGEELIAAIHGTE